MALQRLPSGNLLIESVGGWQRLPDGRLAYDATSGSVDGTASGGTLTGTGSLTGGAATGDATASGGTITGAGSITGGTASAGGDAAAAGATLTGTGSLTGGAATGDANASGGTIAGTGAITGGTATGAVSFTTSAMENNAGSLLASTAVVWEWRQGGTIGAAPVSVTYGSGTTNATGILTVSGIPAGAGELLVATPDVVSVFYQRGDAA